MGYVLATSTPHYNFNYDSALQAVGTPDQLCQTLALSAETDYQTLSSWFADAQFDPADVYADVGANGAKNNGSKINFDAGPIPPGMKLQPANFCRGHINAEADEIFMDAFGWWIPGNSTGEGLSRALAETISPNSVVLSTAGQTPATVWLNGPRGDWTKGPENTDQDYTSIGCSVLFLNFLRFQLGRRWDDIVQAAQAYPGVISPGSIQIPYPLNLDFVFHWLTQSVVPWTAPTGAGFQQFVTIINASFPPGPLVNLTNNNPFPIVGAGTWKPWGSMGTPSQKQFAAAAPAITSYPARELDCFALGNDSAVWHNAFDGTSFSGWVSLGGNFSNGVAAVAMDRTTVFVFAIAADGSLQRNRISTASIFGPSASGWKVINPGKAVGVPAAVSWAPYRVDCFARSAQGTLLHCFSEDKGFTYTAWQDRGRPTLGVTVDGSPAAVTQRPDSINCFVRGSDQQLHQLTWTGPTGWNWGTLPGVGAPTTVVGDPAAVVRAPNLIDLFVEGLTRDIIHFRFNPGRNSWVPTPLPHPGDFLNRSAPAAACAAPDRVELAVIASDSAMTPFWHRTFTVP